METSFIEENIKTYKEKFQPVIAAWKAKMAQGNVKKHVGGRYGLPQEMMDLKIGLTARKFEPLDYKAPDYEEKSKAQAIEKYKISLPMMVRFLGILKEKYPDILAEWQRQRDEDRKNPSMSVADLIDRRYIPQHPELEPHHETLQCKSC